MTIEAVSSAPLPLPLGTEPDPLLNETAGFQFDFRKLVAIVQRNIWIIVGILIAAMLAGLVATLLVTPKYVARATVQINQEADRVLESADVQPIAAYQDADRFLQTQTEILRSRSLAIRVAQLLNLFGNPQFFAAMEANLPEVGPTASVKQVTREATIGLLMRNVEVALPRDSRVVTIAFTSTDPALAARIANAYATEFIQGNLQRKFDSSSYAREFVSGQLGEAKARLEQSERAVNDYARGIRLIRTAGTSGGQGQPGTGPQSVVSASLVQLNQAANQARAGRIEAEQKWRTFANTPTLNIPDVLANSTVQRLLEQRSVAMAQLSQEQARHLEDHPSVRQLRAQLNGINQQIERVGSSIRGAVREQFESMLARENGLIAEVDALKAQTLVEQDQSVRYNILAREADTNRTLYDGLLQRYKELSAAAGISSNNISIIDQAESPLGPSSPKMFLNLLIALVIGVGLAAVTVFVREQLDDAIRVPDDVEAKLSLPVLGVVPVSQAGSIIDELQMPRAPVTEAYNALQTSLIYATQRGLPHRLVITSTQASEGKTTTAIAIAMGLARLGKRTLLIDGDLRRPSLHRVLGRSNDVGMSDLLTGQAGLDDAIVQTNFPNLELIPSGPVPPNPTDLLAGGMIDQLLMRLSERYDSIVIDAPPVLGLADSLLLTNKGDGVLFVIEANRGRRGATKASLRRLRSAHANLVGGVLTKFDPRKNGGAYAYYGYEYYQYGNGPVDAGKRK